MQQTIQLSKKQKLKKLNEKIELMMKNKTINKEKNLGYVQINQNQNISERPLQTKQEQNPQKLNNQIINNQQKNVQKFQIHHQIDDAEENHQIQNGISKRKVIKKEKKKQSEVILRKAAGLVWKDKSLQEWPENDYRIFVGNLGNEVNDQMLSAIFRNKYNSFTMGKVVTDKRTGKSKGYGFISLKQPKDFLRALKQMDGKYIGNRPVKLSKSNWKDRALGSDKNKQLPSDFKANSGKETNKICTNFKYVSPF